MTFEIINLINEIVQKHGLKNYVKKWKPMNSNKEFDNVKELILYINQNLKKYHKHSNLIPLNYYKSFKKKEHRRLPEFIWYSNDKIGKIKFYHFFSCDDNKVNINNQDNLIKITNAYINLWLNKGINGLIIDLRYHKGGNFYPFIFGLKEIFGNTTLFSINNDITDKKEKKWLNLINDKITKNEFITSELKFKKPIAILINKNTKSAGEFSSALFKGRSNVKFFGSNSSGYLTFNSTICLNKKLNLIIPTFQITTVDMIFQDKEFLNVDLVTKTPVKDSKIWINNIKNKYK